MLLSIKLHKFQEHLLLIEEQFQEVTLVPIFNWLVLFSN